MKGATTQPGEEGPQPNASGGKWKMNSPTSKKNATRAAQSIFQHLCPQDLASQTVDSQVLLKSMLENGIIKQPKYAQLEILVGEVVNEMAKPTTTSNDPTKQNDTQKESKTGSQNVSKKTKLGLRFIN